ncbi:hypothetical protein CY34DRAFT_801184 [Suillus luteus UH-Slu-Lm8-n1]|uniref:Uncharacterized protein n=1 Tax=Suillus luteus UH-Slu-Lm8-n1 TaxID=930992 RepID=A0A0D0A6I5_9AGAM|nr:hypothetical protein CY34DRAFT_801184 [Suillus luteus UH-Slu-Lm8-n1]
MFIRHNNCTGPNYLNQADRRSTTFQRKKSKESIEFARHTMITSYVKNMKGPPYQSPHHPAIAF